MANGFSCEVDFTYGTDGNHMAQTSSQKQNQPIPVFYLIYTLTQLHTKTISVRENIIAGVVSK